MDYAKFYSFYGVDITGDTGSELTGDCFLCDKEGHLYINKDSGQWACHRCGEKGNKFNFLRNLYTALEEITSESDLKVVARERKLPVKIIQDSGIVKSVHPGEYLLPIRGGNDEVVALKRWNPHTKTLYNAPGKTGYLFRLRKTNNQSDPIFICEGEWDAIALARMLDLLQKPGDVYAVPGAAVFKDNWADFCSGREVFLCYDNDVSGKKGMDLAESHLRGKASALFRVVWPEEYADKFDIRDLYVQNRKKIRTAYKDLLSWMEEVELDDVDKIFPTYSFSELVGMDDCGLTYIVEDIICKDHSALMIGPSKGLKTSISADLAVSVASGTPFLGHFPVLEVMKVGFMSGESGLPTLRQTLMRIAAARSLDDVPNFVLSPKLPRLKHDGQVEYLESWLEKHEIQMLVLDPAYLMMATGGNEGSLFAMGAMMEPLVEMCVQREITLLINHHTKQNMEVNKYLTVHDASWAGFEQLARQWICLNRREEYVEGSHEHKMLMSSGGSPGHSGRWRLEIQEKQWHVKVFKPTDQDVALLAQQLKNAKTEIARLVKHQARTDQYILDHIDGEPEVVLQAIENLKSVNRIKACFIKDKAGTRHHGWKLNDEIN